jgi:hypothetical protein
VDISGSGERFSASQSGAFNEEGVDVSKSLTSLADLPPTKQKKVVDLNFDDFDDWDFDDADKDQAPSPAKEPVVKKVDQLDKPLKFAIQNKIIVEREADEVNKTLPKLKQKNEW